MDGDGEFVPEDTGIAEKWLFAGECMQIGAAYADTTDTYLHPARLWSIGQWHVAETYVSDLVQSDLEHSGLFSASGREGITGCIAMTSAY
jgi:hypothetical protein